MSPETQLLVAKLGRAAQTCKAFDQSSPTGKRACADEISLRKKVENSGWTAQDAAKTLSEICNKRETLYNIAAISRGAGQSPEDALAAVRSKKWMDLPVEEQKLAINMVYFNRDFQFLSPLQIQMVVHDVCNFGPRDKWEPLK